MTRRFSPRAFKNAVTIKPANYPLSIQGGASPEPGAGWSYPASVQPLGGQAGKVSTGGVDLPVSTTIYDVLISGEYRDDPAVKALVVGDEVTWDDRGGLVLSVAVPPQDSGGLGKLLRIRCEAIQ
jgi:hypothetical protein